MKAGILHKRCNTQESLASDRASYVTGGALSVDGAAMS